MATRIKALVEPAMLVSTVSGYLGVQAKYVPSIERAAFGMPA
jgi:hypothetical protein